MKLPNQLLSLFLAACFLAPLPASSETAHQKPLVEPAGHGAQLKEHEPSPGGGAHAAAPATAGEEGWSVLSELIKGNRRFIESQLNARNLPARRSELVSGQTPKAIILSCSDSRVPPEIVFDQGLGDLFVVRTAGHVADGAAVASIEYAVEHLGSTLLLVLGHESCGAVKATLSTPAGKSAGSSDLDALVSAIRPDVAETESAPGDKAMREPARQHVNGVSSRLVERSKIIKEAVEKGHLLIAGGLYNLKTGKVEIWF